VFLLVSQKIKVLECLVGVFFFGVGDVLIWMTTCVGPALCIRELNSFL
jgi:hypothetical protein